MLFILHNIEYVKSIDTSLIWNIINNPNPLIVILFSAIYNIESSPSYGHIY